MSFLYAVPEGAADERHTRAALELPFVEHTQVQAAVLRERRQEAQPDVHHLEELEARSKNQTSSSTPLRRDKRSAATDPLFETQWHLHFNRHDMGALEPWQRSIGSGVLVAVADDGLEWTHPDLRDAFNPGASYDFNRHAPSPAPTQSGDSHGTRCAGEIAAAVGNGVCGAGLAPGAMLAGLTILAGTVTDVVEADALSHSLVGENAIDIFSCSWGPRDTGTVLEGPGPLARAAVELGFTMGRYGRGAVYVWAAGNGGDGDGCMYDGYASSRYVVAIGSLGEDNVAPYYQENCPAMLAVTYSSSYKSYITTTDTRSGCTMRHSGTSAAAPLAAAVYALALAEHPSLSVRALKHLTVRSALKVPAMENGGAVTNAAGLAHHPKYGFGLLHAARFLDAVAEAAAAGWSEPSPAFARARSGSAPVGGWPFVEGIADSVEMSNAGDLVVEYVEVTVDIAHPRRGALEMYLTSPAGTRVLLASPRPADRSGAGYQQWTFTTAALWGEKAAGTWQLHVRVTDPHGAGPGVLRTWSVGVFGGSMFLRESGLP